MFKSKWKYLFILFCLVIFLVECKKESPEGVTIAIKEITITVAPDTLLADGVSAATVTVIVKYSDGSFAEGKLVTFSTTLGNITPSDTTDANGKATATLTSSTVAGEATITIICSQRLKEISAVFTALGGDVYISSLAADPTSILADGVTTSAISCILKYIDGDSAAANLLVNFSTDLGNITPTDITDSTGTVTATLTSSTSPGTTWVTAKYNDTVKDSVQVVFTTAVGDTIPASVYLYFLDYNAIGVQGTGANEVATIVFQVRDPNGLPVSGARTVDFTIEQGPGGDEYLYPDSAITGDSALVTTHLNSGTVSGPVKVKATVRGTELPIASELVPIAILSGPPHKDHFTISTEKLNLYALWRRGVEDIITVDVNDVWGNPVPENTAVWFYTDCGRIEPGSGTTEQGEVFNTLVSCAPWPESPDSGLFYVYAETVDGDDQLIRDSVRVLWSGWTMIDILPTSFAVPNGGSESFTFTVCDIYRNPLTEGTNISVSTTEGKVMGDVDITLWDTQSRGWTTFWFTLYDDDPVDTEPAAICEVTIPVTSVNGNLSVSVYGTLD